MFNFGLILSVGRKLKNIHMNVSGKRQDLRENKLRRKTDLNLQGEGIEWWWGLGGVGVSENLKDKFQDIPENDRVVLTNHRQNLF